MSAKCSGIVCPSSGVSLPDESSFCYKPLISLRRSFPVVVYPLLHLINHRFVTDRREQMGKASCVLILFDRQSIAGILVCTTLPSTYSLSGQTPVLTASLPIAMASFGSKSQPVGQGDSAMIMRGPFSFVACSIFLAKSSGSAPITVAT